MNELNTMLPLHCRRKQRLTEEEARHRAQRFALDGDRMSAYECEYCGHWHVGHLMGKAGTAVEAGVPESLEAGAAERNRMGLDIQELLGMTKRAREDGRWGDLHRLNRRLQVKQERNAFLKAWLAQQHAARVVGKQKGIAHATTLMDEWAHFYGVIAELIRSSGDQPGLRKAFGGLFAMAVAETPEEAWERRDEFVKRLGMWIASNNEQIA